MTWNRTAEALFGWSAQEAFGKNNPIVPPGERSGSDELHQRIFRGQSFRRGFVLDINNLLTAISGYAELACGSALADPALMRCLDGPGRPERGRTRRRGSAGPARP